MSGTSESELKQLIYSMGLSQGFLGTFDCRFPGFLSKHSSQTAIINTGPREEGGVHWIALYWSPLSYTLYLFDPLGWSERELKRYYGFSYQNLIARSALNFSSRCVKLVKNTQAVQCTCAGSCGLFCVMFLAMARRFPNAPFKNSVFQSFEGSKAAHSPPNPHLLHENQRKLYQYLSNYSSYFNKNKQRLICNTRLGLLNTHA